ncbi:MAG TPA: c-type cytochrome, partial [Pseudomonadales bacterium]
MPFRRSFLALSLLLSTSAFAQDSTRDGIYTMQQAQAGASLYVQSCIECHGATLRGSEAGPALVGAQFWTKWEGMNLAALFQITASTMPVNNPNGFSPQQYANLIALILQQNGLPAGQAPLADNAGALVSITLEESETPVRVASLVNGASTAQRVVDAEWTSYHADSNSTHYSPLDFINKDNVANLEIAWRWYS